MLGGAELCGGSETLWKCGADLPTNCSVWGAIIQTCGSTDLHSDRQDCIGAYESWRLYGSAGISYGLADLYGGENMGQQWEGVIGFLLQCYFSCLILDTEQSCVYQNWLKIATIGDVTDRQTDRHQWCDNLSHAVIAMEQIQSKQTHITDMLTVCTVLQ